MLVLVSNCMPYLTILFLEETVAFRTRQEKNKAQDAIKQIVDVTTMFLWRETDPKAQDASRLPW